jgi:hypothetical protein
MIDSTDSEELLTQTTHTRSGLEGKVSIWVRWNGGVSNVPVPSTTTSYSGAISSMVDIAEKREVRYGKRKADVGKWKRKKVLLGLPPRINEAVRRGTI